MARTWKRDPTSWRTTPRPIGWKTTRVRILERDHHRCTWIEGEPDGGTWQMWADPRRCPLLATDVDHKDGPADHSDGNLRSLCEGHHDHRTAMQANAAKQARGNTRRRPAPRHPGLR